MFNLRRLLFLTSLATIGLSLSAATYPIRLQFGSTNGSSYGVGTFQDAATAGQGGALSLARLNGAATDMSLQSAIEGGDLSEYGDLNGMTITLTPSPANFTIDSHSAGATSAGVTGTATARIAGSGGSIDVVFNLVDIAATSSGVQLNAQSAFNIGSASNYNPTASPAGTNMLLSALAGGAPAYLTFNFSVGGFSSLDAALYALQRATSPLVYTATLYVTPEPTFYGLLASGMIGLYAFSRKRRKS